MISQLTLDPPCFTQHPQTRSTFSLARVNFVFGGLVCLSRKCFEPQADAPTPTHNLISIFSKYMGNLTYHQPRAAHHHSHLDPNFFTSKCSHVYIHKDTHKSPLAPTTKDHFLSYPKATNTLSFEALNSQVAASHSTPLLDNHSMPATPSTPPIPEKFYPIYTCRKPNIPLHNCTFTLHSIKHFFDGSHVTTYPQHGLQTKRYVWLYP